MKSERIQKADVEKLSQADMTRAEIGGDNKIFVGFSWVPFPARDQ
jgi:hypothetical protein